MILQDFYSIIILTDIKISKSVSTLYPFIAVFLSQVTWGHLTILLKMEQIKEYYEGACDALNHRVTVNFYENHRNTVHYFEKFTKFYT